MVLPTLFVVSAYFWGALPTAYLVGRWMKGIDIRQHGTGTVGSANVVAHVGKLSGLFVVSYDCVAKGAVPVFLANIMGQSNAVQVGVGLAAIAGHNWSPYLRFTGGRGVATAVGVLAGFVMWKEMIVLTIIGVGGRQIIRDSGIWTLIGLVILPVLAYLFGQPTEVLFLTLFLGALLVLKRLTANWQLPDQDYSLMMVLANRVLWDRDVASKSP